MPHPLAIDWQSRFGSALPEGSLCRYSMPDRWVRIHSLPAGKRYATTEAEYAELLHRHNTVATYVLGEGARCLAFVTRFGESTNWDSSEEFPFSETPDHVLTASEDEDQFQFFGLAVEWRERSFNELLVAIADDRTGSVLFANTQRGSIYAPYDGGADLFMPSSEAALATRVQFQAWLSDRDDSL